MLILFQVLFALFALFAIATVEKKRRDGLLGPKGLIFWLLFWVASIVVVIWPDSAATVAKVFGIGRGSDFIIYVSLALLFFLIFKLHIKIESIGKDVTSVVRKNAIAKKVEQKK
jgi:small membrane protein